MLSKILVPVDGSALGARAVPCAARLARPTNAGVTLIEAVPDLALIQHAEAELAHAVERLRHQGSAATAAVHCGDPASVILDGVQDRRADLIVMSTHGRSGVGRWLYGSVADSVLRRSSVPVLLVPATCDRALDRQGPIRIVVALDGSELSAEVLAPAAAVAQALGAEMVLLRVVEQHDYGMYAGATTGLTDHAEERRAEAQRLLEAMVDELRLAGHTARARAIVGHPAETIATTAREEQASAIAMATHGRGGLVRFVLGSVATGTLRRADVPLLLARPSRTSVPARHVPEQIAADLAPDGPVVTMMPLSRQELRLLRHGLGELLYEPWAGASDMPHTVARLQARLRSAEQVEDEGRQPAGATR